MVKTCSIEKSINQMTGINSTSVVAYKESTFGKSAPVFRVFNKEVVDQRKPSIVPCDDSLLLEKYTLVLEVDEGVGDRLKTCSVYKHNEKGIGVTIPSVVNTIKITQLYEPTRLLEGIVNVQYSEQVIKLGKVNTVPFVVSQLREAPHLLSFVKLF